MTDTRENNAMRILLFIACSALALNACSDVLDVEYPGRIPTEQLNDPTLAAVLAGSVLGDFECAYSNYTGGSAVHSDEYETSNSNVPGNLWGERGITAGEDSYVTDACEGGYFSIQRPLHTARFQSEQVFTKLSNWTDEQVTNRALLMAQVRTYGAYSYLLMGETFCAVAFDGGAQQPPSAALDIARTQFLEAITLAQQAGNTDILNLARAGLARTEMNLQSWAAAEAAADLIPPGFRVDAGRGSDNARRWNKLFRSADQQGAYVIADAYRVMNDPRVLVVDANRPAFNPGIDLWVTTKYTSLASPIRLASYEEAQLILAEALAQQGDVAGAMAVINAARADVGLGALAAGNQAEAIQHVINERQRELSFEGGHRLNDLLRYDIPWKLGSNPYTGRPYGQTTCWPHPTKEVNGA
ncbi:MAG TPA: RagB/SusD family nutrient uptake outer membrane protein [Gemmatimonadales bacterium]|nr:RagB/SusD family nutrient uptake outer membrane protein [Gemmatimonadales bacterium]